VDRLDADGTRVSGQESTNPPISGRQKTPLFGATSFLVRAILQDRAPNRYYGHWLVKNARKHAAK
jgi:hypothetical protein